jgi:hypothetical protein
VNELELEKLQVRHVTLNETIIITGIWKLTSSNIERIRKLKILESEIKTWKLKQQNSPLL